MTLRRALKLAIANHCALTRKTWEGIATEGVRLEPVCSRRGSLRLCIGGTVGASCWEPEIRDLLATER